MKKEAVITLIFSFFIVSQIHAQCTTGGGLINHELGVIAGPTFFKADYKSDSKIDLNNMGVGVGLVHYMNFSAGDARYFNDHFKLRNEIDYHTTKLKHHGADVDDSENGEKLAAMHGKAKVLEIGTNLEWYPLGITNFQSGQNKLAPYLGFGVHFAHYNPEAETDLEGGDLGWDEAVTPSGYLSSPGEKPYINPDSGSTIAFAGNVGVRYKLSPRSDLQLDARLTYYGSDKVDGIQKGSSFNDAMGWVSLGYIFYLSQ